jgi:hypothetical protein
VQEVTFDYRARAEANRANSWLNDCANEGNQRVTPGSQCDCGAFNGPVQVPIGDYSVYLETQVDFELNGCAPAIIVISPNGESFPNSHTFSFFPASLPIDPDYGSRWQYAITQAVTDPFFQKPHNPPAIYDALTESEISTFVWLQDDGTCKVDDLFGETPVAYYAHPAMIEACNTLPTGAPTPPPEVVLEFLSPVTNVYVAGGDVASAPDVGGMAPWTFFTNVCGCIGAMGRFYGEYSTWMLCGIGYSSTDCDCAGAYFAPVTPAPPSPGAGDNGGYAGDATGGGM